MPHKSTHQELLDELDVIALHVMEARARNKLQLVQVESDIDDNDLYVDNEEKDMFEPIIISPPSPIPPLLLLNILDSESESNSQDSDSMYDLDKPYQRLLGEIIVLCDEAEQAQFLNRFEVPLLCTPQVHLLEHFVVFQPLLFCKKLHVEPEIFDCIFVRNARPTQTYFLLPASWMGDTHEETDFLPIGDQEEKDVRLLNHHTDKIGTGRVLMTKYLQTRVDC